MSFFSFVLPKDFVASYAHKRPSWGYTDAGDNSLGEITFLRTYSRLKKDGSKEQWFEVCERVINGMYSLQKDHCLDSRLPWSDSKANESAMEAYDRMFNFKWTPPGRGLWVMGTPIVNEDRNSAALQNCAFVSTHDMPKDNPAKPFSFLMEASMLGVGVGFDNKGGDLGFVINTPIPAPDNVFVIPDTREGWVDSVAMLINSFLIPDSLQVSFDYSLIRPLGAPIKTFGGTASGPDPLIKLHEHIVNLFAPRSGDLLSRTDIADLGNMIGVCVVSGNVRRSAELLIGSVDDEDFLNLKNYGSYSASGDFTPGPAARRQEWGWMSNNSVEVKVGQDLSPIIDRVAHNGEPGVIWMDVSRQYGRLVDPPNNKDHRVAGYNPCAEQSLESFEMCTLVETYLNRHDNLEDYQRTLKFAYLYAKTVTLLPTHWEETTAIMQRNRRIGASMSGVANFADAKGLPTLRSWMDSGYKTIEYYDNVYSEWLCIRPSIKTTTVKPSGTVSILAGESPGVHWTPGGKFFLRAIRFANNDPMVALFREAGYLVEPAFESPDSTSVVFFPVKSDAARSDKDVSIFEKMNLAATAQRYWSDNSVSVTVSFNAALESDHVATVLHMYDGQLKTVSFLPQGNDVYQQMPYTQISKSDFEAYFGSLSKVDLNPIYSGLAEVLDASGEAYCTTDRCEIPTTPGAAEFEDKPEDSNS